MSALALHLGSSVALLGTSLYIAWNKRLWRQGRIVCLSLGVFWLPAVTLRILVFEKAGRSWEWLIISITWLALLLVLGLCVMYGSKKIHAHGRLMIILSLAAITALLSALGLSH
jgi:hypothetical protein